MSIGKLICRMAAHAYKLGFVK